MVGVRCHFMHSMYQFAFGGGSERKEWWHDNQGCSGGPVGGL